MNWIVQLSRRGRRKKCRGSIEGGKGENGREGARADYMMIIPK